MSTDVEAAKRLYLSQWSHCSGKRVMAVNHYLVCDCGAKFDWERALGEDVALALDLGWLTPNDTVQIQEQGTDQLGMF